ncbi:MAG: molybdopterin converting factor subunit 1 [Pseudomonadota bacterium]|nr:molybdopterin converting factor subunit 1 [Pseudomonadota bacterium]
MIKVRYFARLREQLGTAGEELEYSDRIATVADLSASLRQRRGPWADALAQDQTLMAAVNQEMARPETPIGDGDEVAFFPPVTGG